MPKKTNQPDKNLFKGFKTNENKPNIPMQKVVPAKKEIKAEKPVHFLVTEEQKYRFDVYRVKAGLKQRDFLVNAVEEYMVNHPLDQ